jgi:hypothetical protein
MTFARAGVSSGFPAKHHLLGAELPSFGLADKGADRAYAAPAFRLTA